MKAPNRPFSRAIVRVLVETWRWLPGPVEGPYLRWLSKRARLEGG